MRLWLGITLQGQRLDSGMTQNDLAATVRRPQSFVSKLEAGDGGVELVDLLEIADVLAVDVADLVVSAQTAWERERRVHRERRGGR